MLEKFSATIDTMYAAALGQKPWNQALNRIEELTGSVGAVIGFVPKSEASTGFNLAGRFTAEQCAIYSQEYQPICRRTRYMIEHPGLDVIHDSLFITEQEMDTDPVYDWFGKHDLRYFVGAALPPTRTHLTVTSLQRSPTQGHVQAADIAVFRQVKLHLGRAVTLADQIGSLRSFDRISSAMLAALPQALFALDASGRVAFANDAATALLRKGDGLEVRAGSLWTSRSSETAALNRLVAEANGDVAEACGGWIQISRPSGRTAYAVFVAPLPTGEEDLADGANVLVIVHDPSEARPIDLEMLRKLYGLTDTEARLASALACGHSLESAATLLRIQVTTTRSHLKSIFAKLNVNRQQELVRLLTSLSSISV